MRRPILAGIETEYGLAVEGRGAEHQVDDASAFVRACPERAFAGWDYRHESPRCDLRGFQLERLAVDPVDARFDAGRAPAPSEAEIRSDLVLSNGARFYNDHGHPEYATPECWSLDELALHDRAGEEVLRRTAAAFTARTGRKVKIYKNNSDGHGASYGTHESYLAPRSLGFDGLFAAVAPMLVARTVLCGAGKVGSEAGARCDFQLSQRADFLTEVANAETLYRRPVFNTRDEPHADPRLWIRLHVISGDANMMPSCTRRKAGLVKLALALAEVGEAPRWELEDLPAAFRSVSRDATRRFEIRLRGSSWTTAYEILESYFSAAERLLELDGEERALIEECRRLSQGVQEGRPEVRRAVDWAAKLHVLETYRDEHGADWGDPMIAALALAYHDLDPEEGLYFALEEIGEVDWIPKREDVLARCHEVFEGTRAAARGHAVLTFFGSLTAVSWSCLTMRNGPGVTELYLAPDQSYPVTWSENPDVDEFVALLRGTS